MAQNGKLDIDVRVNDRAAHASIKSLQSSVIRFAGALTAAFAVVRGAAFPIQAAAEFDKELRNVQKTTGFTSKQVKTLGDDLISLSKETNVATLELVKIAAVAGQLGLGSQGGAAIASFTETAARLASVLGITAEVAASSVAKISNVFNISLKNSENIGAAINELSNQSTASGEELINITARIGSVAGLTLDQVLALSAAGKNFGLQTEVIGTSFVKVFSNMTIRAENFAQLMNVSTEQWTATVAKDGVGAFNSVLTKLSEFDEIFASTFIKTNFGGGRIFSVVDKFRRDLSAGGDELERYRDLASTAFDEGTSAIREQQTVLGGVIAQWDILKNVVFSIGQDIGSNFLEGILKQIEELSVVLQSPASISFFSTIAEGIGTLGSALVFVVKTAVEYASVLKTLLAAWLLLTGLKIASYFIKVGSNMARSIGVVAASTTGWEAWALAVLKAKKARELLNIENAKSGRPLVATPGIVTPRGAAENYAPKILAAKRYKEELKLIDIQKKKYNESLRLEGIQLRKNAVANKESSRVVKATINERLLLNKKLEIQIAKQSAAEAAGNARSAAGHKGNIGILRKRILVNEQVLATEAAVARVRATSTAGIVANTTALAADTVALKANAAASLAAAGGAATTGKAKGASAVVGLIGALGQAMAFLAKGLVRVIFFIGRFFLPLAALTAAIFAFDWIVDWVTGVDAADAATNRLSKSQQKQAETIRDLADAYTDARKTRQGFESLAIDNTDIQETASFSGQAKNVGSGASALLATGNERSIQENDFIIEQRRRLRDIEEKILSLKKKIAEETSKINGEQSKGEGASQKYVDSLQKVRKSLQDELSSLSEEAFVIIKPVLDPTGIEDALALLTIESGNGGDLFSKSIDALIEKMSKERLALDNSAKRELEKSFSTIFSGKTSVVSDILEGFGVEGILKANIKFLEDAVADFEKAAPKTAKALKDLAEAEQINLSIRARNQAPTDDNLDTESEARQSLFIAKEKEKLIALELIRNKDLLKQEKARLKVQTQINASKLKENGVTKDSELNRIAADASDLAQNDQANNPERSLQDAQEALKEYTKVQQTTQQTTENVVKSIRAAVEENKRFGRDSSFFKDLQISADNAAARVNRLKSAISSAREAVNKATISGGSFVAGIANSIQGQRRAVSQYNKDLAFGVTLSKEREAILRNIASNEERIARGDKFSNSAKVSLDVNKRQLEDLEVEQNNAKNLREYEKQLSEVKFAQESVNEAQDKYNKLILDVPKGNVDLDELAIQAALIDNLQKKAESMVNALRLPEKDVKTYGTLGVIWDRQLAGSESSIINAARAVAKSGVELAKSNQKSLEAQKPKADEDASQLKALRANINQRTLANEKYLEDVKDQYRGASEYILTLETLITASILRLAKLRAAGIPVTDTQEQANALLREALTNGNSSAENVQELTRIVTTLYSEGDPVTAKFYETIFKQIEEANTKVNISRGELDVSSVGDLTLDSGVKINGTAKVDAEVEDIEVPKDALSDLNAAIVPKSVSKDTLLAATVDTQKELNNIDPVLIRSTIRLPDITPLIKLNSVPDKQPTQKSNPVISKDVKDIQVASENIVNFKADVQEAVGLWQGIWDDVVGFFSNDVQAADIVNIPEAEKSLKRTQKIIKDTQKALDLELSLDPEVDPEALDNIRELEELLVNLNKLAEETTLDIEVSLELNEEIKAALLKDLIALGDEAKLNLDLANLLPTTQKAPEPVAPPEPKPFVPSAFVPEPFQDVEKQITDQRIEELTIDLKARFPDDFIAIEDEIPEEDREITFTPKLKDDPELLQGNGIASTLISMPVAPVIDPSAVTQVQDEVTANPLTWKVNPDTQPILEGVNTDILSFPTVVSDEQLAKTNSVLENMKRIQDEKKFFGTSVTVFDTQEDVQPKIDGVRAYFKELEAVRDMVQEIRLTQGDEAADGFIADRQQQRNVTQFDAELLKGGEPPEVDLSGNIVNIKEPSPDVVVPPVKGTLEVTEVVKKDTGAQDPDKKVQKIDASLVVRDVDKTQIPESDLDLEIAARVTDVDTTSLASVDNIQIELDATVNADAGEIGQDLSRQGLVIDGVKLTGVTFDSAAGGITAATGGLIQGGKVVRPSMLSTVMQSFSTGGRVFGAGTATSDSIPAWLSNGEYVMDAKSVRHFGSNFFSMLQNMSKTGTKLPGFATGGAVSSDIGSGIGDTLTKAVQGLSGSSAPQDSIRIDLGIGDSSFSITSPRDQVAALNQALLELGG